MIKKILICFVPVLFFICYCAVQKEAIIDGIKEEPAIGKKEVSKPASKVLKPEEDEYASGAYEDDKASRIMREDVIGTKSTAKFPSASGLKAGFADDNKQFNYFVKFLEQYKTGVEHYYTNINERIIIRVCDSGGKSLANAGVRISGNDRLLCDCKTYSDGSMMFFPSEYGGKITSYSVKISFKRATKVIKIDRQGKREITVNLDISRPAVNNIPADILFIMDTTGSMGEEINRLKSTIEIINMNLASFSMKPELRFGMVLYRDKSDEYVTSVIPLTKNLEKFREELDKVTADGGGDGPEDLQSALGDAIHKIKWNDYGLRLCFAITDAPPHLDYGQEYTYINAMHDARDRAIRMFTVGTGGLDISGEYILRQISQYTGSKYIFLTYGEKGESEGGAEGSVSHHTGSNFQTDKLESIIIRFAKEELAWQSDQPLEPGGSFIQANRIDDEKNEETLMKLNDMCISQLADYSSINIASGTTVSIIPFFTDNDSLKAEAEYFSEQMSLSLGRSKLFKMVERKDMQKILKELELQYTGLVGDEGAAKAGRLLGAEMMITGRLYGKGGNYEIFVKLLRVETAEVLSVNKLIIDKMLGLGR